MDGYVHRRQYEAVLGYFQQDFESHEPTPVPPRFGLIDDSPERWTRLDQKLKDLNANARPGESFKLCFFWRHGQSFHNVGKAKYGPEEWKRKWAKLNGDGEIVWGPDANLTELGVAQALDIKREWQNEKAYGVLLPDIIYTSPLTRALRTCDIAFDWLVRRETSVPVLVVEDCREENGMYTYDKRRSLSYIKNSFPFFRVEKGFTMEDELWLPDVRESKEAMVSRARSVLDRIFSQNPPVTYLCCTIHGGLINAFLSVLGLPKRSIPTGGVCPVIIRGYIPPQ